MIMEKVKTRTLEMWKDDHGIFWVKVKPVVEIDKEDIADNLLVTRNITNNIPHLRILDSRTNWKMTPEAQEYYKTEDIPERTIAKAILVNTTTGKLIKSFLVKLHNPNVPLRFFTSEAEAIKWLLEFK